MGGLYPMRIEPRYDQRIWGGHNLAERLGKDAPRDEKIGESWEIYDENRVINGEHAGSTIAQLRETMGTDLMGHVSVERPFPMLTKLIDAQDVLSVQVHPDDEEAQHLEHEHNGKTECWYIIDAAPDAELILGFSRDTSPDEYEQLVADGKLNDVLRSIRVRPGDVVYLPARTLHAIGAGIVLHELQQTSDVTYRIYDWNRTDDQGKPRELHVDKARQVLDFHHSERGVAWPLKYPQGARSMLVAGPYFCMELIDARDPIDLETHNSPVGICALAEGATVRASGESVELPRYSSLLVPAAAQTMTIRSLEGGRANCLVVYVPQSQRATRDDLLRQGLAEAEVDAFLKQF